jgi:hypothetical protein
MQPIKVTKSSNKNSNLVGNKATNWEIIFIQGFKGSKVQRFKGSKVQGNCTIYSERKKDFNFLYI